MDKIVFSSKPVKMWIDGTCFNIKSLENIKKTLNASFIKSDCDSTSASESHNFTINKTENNFSTSFQLPSTYYIRLNSFPHFNLKKLEKESNTTICIPMGGKDGNITITGSNESDVISTRELFHSIVGEIRSNEKPSQFISIPVNSEEVQRNFQLFKDEILNGDPIQGVDETIFQSPLKLHLTVGVLALMDNVEKDEAISTLTACKTDVVEPMIGKMGQLKVKVSGIASMNDNVAKVNILYANAKIEENEDVLQNLANAISDYFYEHGLVIQYRDSVKLHVTLMNTRYRKPTAPNTPKRSNWRLKKQPFDATRIFDKYKDFCFGEKMLDSIHLSYMSSVGEDGFYKPLSIINV